MKKDLALAFFIGVLGLAIGYIVTNMFVNEPEEVTFKTVDGADLSTDLATPDDKIFNYLALNPTVEVYIGGCESYDVDGTCIMSDSQRGELLRQARQKALEQLGYYDRYGYFHQYEYDDEGFYDYDGYYFRFGDGGYYDEDNNFYEFGSDKKGYYDGAEYKNANSDNEEEDEEDDENSGSELEDYMSELNNIINGNSRRNNSSREED